MKNYGLIACALLWLYASAAAAAPVVFAASSLQGALDKVADSYAAQGNPRPVISYAGSAVLARQIIAGAPADIYISADQIWMQALVAHGAVGAASVKALLGNDLVLVAPRQSKARVRLKRGETLTPLVAGGRLAMGDPKSVPAGTYGRAALQNMGLWSEAEKKAVYTDSARQALMLAARGEVALAIVFGSDARMSQNVRVVARFPKNSHAPIIYPAALLRSARSLEAQKFYRYMQSGAARKIFLAHGFLTVEQAR